MSTHLSRLICRGSAVASSEPAPVNVWIYRLVSLTLSPFIHSNPAKALRSAGIREVEELPVLLVFLSCPFVTPELGCTLDSICWVGRTQFVLEAVVGLHTATALNRFTLSEILVKNTSRTPLSAPLFLFLGQQSAVTSPLGQWTWWWCETERNCVCERVREWMWDTF